MQFLSIPTPVREILERLQTHGFAAYLVGGCVRDGLLGKVPHDWDICTAAPPGETLHLFPTAVTTGIRHGTVTVLHGGFAVEVTTFRAESAYSDHRHPDSVRFVSDPVADLARRDFTINAMALSADGTLLDPFGGQADLTNGILRAVGVPEQRFQEDALRMLRAVRFSAQLGFCLESETQAAICRCAPLTAGLATERVREEVEKILLSPNPQLLGDAQEMGLLRHYLPEGTPDWAALRTTAPNRLQRWMALGCLLIRAGATSEAFSTLRLDRKTAQACHACTMLQCIAPRTELTWKAAIAKWGPEVTGCAAEVLSALDGGCDATITREILRRGDCCTLQQLAVSGYDLQRLGLQGKEIGCALQALLRYVWAHPEQNKKSTLIHYISQGGL